ncbi:hypothetical protein J5N97_006640 [Dioscorea zingiberensis]|uniref:Pentatricopeptide repeat-containing protein n=1 Tax=Dioscorea zingiberensis TaxID=325984 RepID=A0A9D5DBR3_9LILI|nr:hypothetical protein J5N97_006640 [Dioscorea zingiberensis]
MRRLCWLGSRRRMSSSLESYNSREQHLVSLLEACNTMRDLGQAHGRVIRTGFDQHVFVVARVLTFCAVSDQNIDSMDYAISVFDRIRLPDAFIWNTMIRGLARARRPRDAFLFFRRMRHRGKAPDSFTFSFLIKLCRNAAIGAQLHGCVLRHGLQSHAFVRNTLIHMYGMLGDMSNARWMFEEMPGVDVDTVSWNSLIDGYVHCGEYREALRMFLRMQRSGFGPDEATVVVTLSACSELGALDFGRWVHSRLSSDMLRDFISVSNSLIDMYAKCGAIDRARDVFEGMKERRNVVSWNSMILGLAMHGYADQALTLFNRMRDASPDGITFLGVLCACAHGGLVDEGRRHMESMTRDYGIKPTVRHYGCVVDLLGRAGLVREAYELIKGMPVEGNAVVWRTLLAACRVHGDLQLGERVQTHLQELEEHSSDYVLLSHMYAGRGRWNEVFRLREAMQGRGVQKPEPGNSLINTLPKQ